MKIGIISNLYPPYVRGGAEHVVVRTVEGLTEKGHDVFVVTACRKEEGRGIHRSYSAAERIYRFFPKNLYFVLDDYKHSIFVRLFWHIIDAFSSFPATCTEDILSQEGPDVVITHNLKGIGLRVARAVQRSGARHIHVVHDLQLIYPSGLLFAGKERKPLVFAPVYGMYRFVCRFLMGSPDLVMFPSQYLKDQYLSHGFFKHTKTEVIPNPAPEFMPIERKGETNGPMRLLFIGQLEDHKGIQFLLDAIKGVDDARLIIAGEGTCSKLVEREAKTNDQVTYLGYIAIDQLISILGIVDALVVPSLCYENSPTVIYESLQAGVPVLASDIGGVAELIKPGVNGFLFNPGSKEGFFHAVEQLRTERQTFFAAQDQIKSTVAPYVLSQYVKQFEDRVNRLLISRE